MKSAKAAGLGRSQDRKWCCSQRRNCYSFHIAVTLSNLFMANGFANLHTPTRKYTQPLIDLRVVTRTSGNASSHSSLTTLSAWEPRSRFWMDEEMKDFSPTELAIQMDVDLDFGGSFDREDIASPEIEKMHVNSKGQTVAVEITSSITEHEASVIRELANSLQTHDLFGPTQFESRSFGPDKGGNDVTYLAPLLQMFRPQMSAKVVSLVELAYEKAGWWEAAHASSKEINVTLPHPSKLGIRTSEFLCYDGWRSLEAHKDIGSIYTVMIALKEPRDYIGGDFFLQTSFLEQTEIKPSRLSAIVFLSNTIHGVRPISDGIRESFVTELWIHDDVPLGMKRPTPEEWEAFLETVGE